MTKEEIKQVDLLHRVDVKFNKLSLREHLIVEEATKELQQDVIDLLKDIDDINKQHEEEVNALEAQIEKMKQAIDNARENANKQEQWEIYSVLNDIYNDNFEVITSVSN